MYKKVPLLQEMNILLSLTVFYLENFVFSTMKNFLRHFLKTFIRLCTMCRNEPLNMTMYRIARNFWDRKLLRISRFCGYSQKQYLGNGIFGMAKVSRIHKSFLHENCIFRHVHLFVAVTGPHL